MFYERCHRRMPVVAHFTHRGSAAQRCFLPGPQAREGQAGPAADHAVNCLSEEMLKLWNCKPSRQGDKQAGWARLGEPRLKQKRLMAVSSSGQWDTLCMFFLLPWAPRHFQAGVKSVKSQVMESLAGLTGCRLRLDSADSGQGQALFSG
jgi:hypothetical protein